MRRATFGHFFLTSKPYFGLDNDGFLQTDFSILSAKLSIQPSVRESITSKAIALVSNVWGGQKNYQIPPEAITAKAIALVSNVWGGAKNYQIPPEAITAKAVASVANVFGGKVNYIMAPEAITSKAVALSAEVYTP